MRLKSDVLSIREMGDGQLLSNRWTELFILFRENYFENSVILSTNPLSQIYVWP